MSAPGQDAPAEGAPTTSTTEASPASFDISPVMDRMSELATNLGGINTRLESFEQRLPQPEPQAEPDPWADLFGTQTEAPEGFDSYGQPVQPQQPQMDPQAFQNAVQQAIQQNNAPLLERLQRFELQQAQQALYEQIPQIREVPVGHADYETNQAARQQLAQLAQAATAGFSEQARQEALANPNFLVMTWKAAEADRLAQGQAPAGGAPALEAAGGALPGGTSEPVNPVDAAYANRPTLAKGFQ